MRTQLPSLSTSSSTRDDGPSVCRDAEKIQVDVLIACKAMMAVMYMRLERGFRGRFDMVEGTYALPAFCNCQRARHF